AIALALENNLDVEFQRFEPLIASTDTERAKGGGTLRGISLATAELPAGVGAPSTPLLTAAASGTLPGTTAATSLANLAVLAPPSPSGIGITGAAPLSLGPGIPVFDPSLTGSLSRSHQTTPEVNTLVSGTNSLISNTSAGTVGWQQGFSTGTLISSSINASRLNTNSSRNVFNPYSTSGLGLTVTQPLLRGFGVQMNRRFIRIAKNNEKTSDLVFRQQLIATVAGVIRLYNDLVSWVADVAVREETLAVAQRLYEDNANRVRQGTLAPVELTRAEAQVAAARQDLANSQGFEEQQELLLKSVLTRRGTADAAVRDARLIPTTPIEVPDQEPVRPVADLIATAFRSRPELAEARLQMENAGFALAGSRNNVLPEVDLVASAQNAGLAGTPIAPAVSSAPGTTGTSLLPTGGISSSEIGGLPTGLSQLFTGRFPSYSVGVQFVLPLRNRVAQADLARDEMISRQWQVSYQQIENQVRLEVEAALVALTRSRTAYDAAVSARALQEESLRIEMERYTNGLSTPFLVMQYEGQVAQARGTEVAVRDQYITSRTALERAVGDILENHNVSIDEAIHGRVAQPPSAIPALPPVPAPPVSPGRR
ncbi:MAG: TolC family protein, partial [Acidobacteriia bacterium]|nr:TolC family protein [Terriglobia bacterium]